MIYLLTYRGVLYDVYWFYNENDTCFYSTTNTSDDGYYLVHKIPDITKIDERQETVMFEYVLPCDELIVLDFFDIPEIIEKRMFDIILNKI